MMYKAYRVKEDIGELLEGQVFLFCRDTKVNPAVFEAVPHLGTPKAPSKITAKLGQILKDRKMRFVR